MRRISCALEFVTRVTTQRWALAVMLDLKGVHKAVNAVNSTGTGLGLGYRRLGMDIGFTALDVDAVIKGYRKSRSRLILVDYGGTIVSNDNVSNLNLDESFPSFPCPHTLAARQPDPFPNGQTKQEAFRSNEGHDSVAQDLVQRQEEHSLCCERKRAPFLDKDIGPDSWVGSCC